MMDALTIIVPGAVGLLIAIFVGWRLKSRKTLPSPPVTPTRPGLAQARAVAINAPESNAFSKLEVPTAPPAIDLDDAEINRLRLKLINRFGGNRGAMTRSITLEQKKFPHLSEKGLLDKMLYDLERGH